MGPQPTSYSETDSKLNIEPRVNYKFEPVKMVKDISPAGKAALRANKEY